MPAIAPPWDYAQKVANYVAYRLAALPCFGFSEIDDLRQELLLAVLRRWPQFDADRASPRTFVSRIIRSRALDLARRAGVHKRRAPAGGCQSLTVDPAMVPSALAPAGAELELREEVNHILNSLPIHMQHTAWMMTRTNLRTHPEVVGVAVAGVDKRLLRLRRKFRTAGLTGGDA